MGENLHPGQMPAQLDLMVFGEISKLVKCSKLLLFNLPTRQLMHLQPCMVVYQGAQGALS